MTHVDRYRALMVSDARHDRQRTDVLTETGKRKKKKKKKISARQNVKTNECNLADASLGTAILR